MKGETYRLRVVVSHTGRLLYEEDGPTVAGLMGIADLLPHREASAIIRGEYTSDGTHHGPGRGRVYATREGKRWLRY